MTDMRGNVFDIKIILPKTNRDNFVYIVYNRTLIKRIRGDVDKSVFYDLKPNEYLARIEISPLDGRVVNIKMGIKPGIIKTPYSPADVYKIIDASSIIATGSFGREDPVIYVSTILRMKEKEEAAQPQQARKSLPNTGKVEIRFPYYKPGDTGAENPSKAAKAVIDRYFSNGCNHFNILLVPYAVDEKTAGDGHIVLLCVRLSNPSAGIKDNGEKRYIIDCFDSSSKFIGTEAKRTTRHAQKERYFGCLEKFANISAISHSDEWLHDDACSYYFQGYALLCLSEQTSNVNVNTAIADANQLIAELLQIRNQDTITIAGEMVSTDMTDYAETAYLFHPSDGAGRADISEDKSYTREQRREPSQDEVSPKKGQHRGKKQPADQALRESVKALSGLETGAAQKHRSSASQKPRQQVKNAKGKRR